MIAGGTYPGGWSARDLHRLQLRLERIGVGEGNTLVRISGDNPDDIPRFLVVEFGDGCENFFRHDLPPEVRKRLAALPAEQAFRDRGVVEAILAEDSPCEDMSIFASYVFPEELTPEQYLDAARLPGKNDIGRPLFGVIAGGEAVSVCSSVREDDRCAEAYVWTESQYRQRGYARQAVSAWAHDLQERGKLPFYSHKMGNVASKAIAHSLGLRRFLMAAACS